MDKLLSLLEENARLTNAQLAVMLDTTEAAVAADPDRKVRTGRHYQGVYRRFGPGKDR